LEIEFATLIIVYELDALKHLIVIILDELLGANFAYVVELLVADSADVLHQVLTEALHKTLDVFLFSQKLHVFESRLNALIIV